MSPMRVVTLDGPAGSGKSSTAKALADRLGWDLLDTGAMYRAVALGALRAGIDLEDPGAVASVAARAEVQMRAGSLWLDGEDVSAEIRTVRVTRVTRYAANNPEVRGLLVGWQRQFALDHGRVVTEGRDQGTVVFPDAFLKVFITATPEVRARRRHAEFAAKGEAISYEDVLRDQIRRDEEDRARAVGPLKPAPDAVTLDTSEMTPEGVLGWLEGRVREALKAIGDGGEAGR